MSSIDIKELKESLGFGLVFATIKAGFDYYGRKPTMTYFAKNGGIAARADVVYEYGKSKNSWGRLSSQYHLSALFP